MPKNRLYSIDPEDFKKWKEEATNREELALTSDIIHKAAITASRRFGKSSMSGMKEIQEQINRLYAQLANKEEPKYTEFLDALLSIDDKKE